MKELWIWLIDLLKNESFTIGVLSSISVMFIAYIGKQVVSALECRSDTTGWWYTRIIDNNIAIKSDWYRLYHNRRAGMIKGYMKRFWPKDQSGREWKVAGRLSFNTLILYSYSNKLETSTAAAVVRLKEPRIFIGEYLRYNEETNQLDRVQIQYFKAPPDVKSKKSIIAFQNKLIEDFQINTTSSQDMTSSG